MILPTIAAARADSFVYWTVFWSAGNGMVSRANTDGTIPNYTFLKGLFGAQAIAVDTTYIYWANGPDGIGRPTSTARARASSRDPSSGPASTLRAALRPARLSG